jgi:hypothetical protein
VEVIEPAFMRQDDPKTLDRLEGVRQVEFGASQPTIGPGHLLGHLDLDG